MKYINKKTQAVIKTACVLNGGDWEKVGDEQPKNPAKTTASKTTRKRVKDNE